MDTVEYVELFWDCPSCGQAHISAIHNLQGNRCPNCLHWRTEDVQLYEAPDSQVITDPALINRQPFWICKICHAVNEDTGLSPDLLQCGNCNGYQTSEIGEITGNQAADQQAPTSVVVGEPVEFRENTSVSKARSAVQTLSQNRQPKSRVGRLVKALTYLNLIGGGVLASLIVLSQDKDPSLLQVQVTDLVWTAEAEVQTQTTLTSQTWGELPSGASLIKSERRQRGTRQEQHGLRTVKVQKRYQSGTRLETYTEPEQYQSGVRVQTYTEPERYQSGTRTETYVDSERYLSGTNQECRTTSRGSGIGERSCRSVSVYRTRPVQRTRTVPAYSIRQVQRTRMVPVYQTRQVQRTRTVPVYRTRQVSVQQPIFVDIPVYDQLITYQEKKWIPLRVYRQMGRDDVPRRSPTVKLLRYPPQRISATSMTCHLSGTYTIKESWFAIPESKVGNWALPCQEYDRINIGDRVQLRESGAETANLMRVISH